MQPEVETELKYSTAQLIQLVKNLPLLWDTKHADFYYKHKRSAAWMAIAKHLVPNFDEASTNDKLSMVTKISGHWRKLRHSYTSAFRYRTKNPGADASQGMYDKELEFLANYLTDTRKAKDDAARSGTYSTYVPGRRMTRAYTIVERPRGVSGREILGQPARRNRRLETRVSPYRQLIQEAAQNGNTKPPLATAAAEDNYGNCIGFVDQNNEFNGVEMPELVMSQEEEDTKPALDTGLMPTPFPLPAKDQTPGTALTPPTSEPTTESTPPTTAPTPPPFMVSLPYSCGTRAPANPRTVTIPSPVASSSSSVITTTTGPPQQASISTNAPASADDPEEADQGFFNIIKPLMRKLSTKQKLDFHIEVLSLLRNMQE